MVFSPCEVDQTTVSPPLLTSLQFVFFNHNDKEVYKWLSVSTNHVLDSKQVMNNRSNVLLQCLKYCLTSRGDWNMAMTCVVYGYIYSPYQHLLTCFKYLSIPCYHILYVHGWHIINFMLYMVYLFPVFVLLIEKIMNVIRCCLVTLGALRDLSRSSWRLHIEL